MILHSDREGNDCIRKLRCHCIQIMHSDIYSVCKIRILKGLGVILLRSSKMLLTFEFWLNWIQVLKAKHCCGLSTNLLFSFQYKPDIKQNMVVKIEIPSHYWIFTKVHQGLFKSFGLYSLYNYLFFVWITSFSTHLPTYLALSVHLCW